MSKVLRKRGRGASMLDKQDSLLNTSSPQKEAIEINELKEDVCKGCQASRFCKNEECWLMNIVNDLVKEIK